MAVPWLTVLKAVPWSDVISNAPKVAEGAKKLWKTMGRKPGAEGNVATDIEPVPATGPQNIDTLHQRLLRMESANTELRQQLFASGELLNALAEQNTSLIARVDLLRTRARRLTIALTVVAGMALTALVLVLAR